ncbi:MAG TPA: GNAT family N-acetyltransferase [Pseudonocardiaceae bacterium]|jgi:GNAT superfamily N-acetyltransferase|nr:GNAT family N-acetyltransferase [Pseudonocardiaceae bacterium]
MGTVTVEPLANRQDLVVPLARLRWHEWGGHPGREALEWWIGTTARESGQAGLPATFAAVDTDGDVVGGVGLVPSEHRELADRGPWVVGVIVRDDRRGQGIGAVMMAGLAEWAIQAGIDRLWVVADGRAVAFYRRCGFDVVEVVQLSDGGRPTLLTARPRNVGAAS